MAVKPTIKGIFVKSHIRALRRKKGELAVRELERRFGKPLRFKNSESVAVRDEVRLLELIVDITHRKRLTPRQRAYQAGRLHFQNFATTPFARIIFSLFKKRFKMLLLQAQNIAGHVFRGVRFTSQSLGPKSISLIMENNDYPIEHFRGLFQSWMTFAGLSGSVSARTIAPKTYQYIFRWR